MLWSVGNFFFLLQTQNGQSTTQLGPQEVRKKLSLWVRDAGDGAVQQSAYLCPCHTLLNSEVAGNVVMLEQASRETLRRREGCVYFTAKAASLTVLYLEA